MNSPNLRPRAAIVVTTISAPTAAMNAIGIGCRARGHDFIVIGDVRSPVDFELPGARYYSVAKQRELEFRYSQVCPVSTYARKNIGYLIALADGADVILETDDDNFPEPEFWRPLRRLQLTPIAADTGWVNVYHYFTDAPLWPRGLPLNQVKLPPKPYDLCPTAMVDCPIQQGLADEDPDLDAVCRLVMPLPQKFRRDRQIALERGAWCPFNSQNTAWWREAAPLLYLPATCSFRMSDIWRSFIAQRIAWENDWAVLFHGPTVRQKRNAHDLMVDFKDEICGYLNNAAICEELSRLPLKSGAGYLAQNLEMCYQRLVALHHLEEAELPLLEKWLEDLSNAAGPFANYQSRQRDADGLCQAAERLSFRA